ncbi:hypothetical protein DSL72_003208 [Monilinia vaccinii-corymbosi]|uniref:Ice-binding protein n=1 Tax=Monilinia vaccinii-corymbosi TaxID=61207 RepID=A0A8A3P5H1_9HELO|nr:hypothetical protein DSL72_003208 [Monilinia vaccinii-corymbosi]
MHIASLLFWFAALVTPGLTQINLGIAVSYGALAESGITNTGSTTINGNVGTTGSSIIGFHPGDVVGTSEAATDTVVRARADALAAYNIAQGLHGGIESTANSELGGQTLPAGIYRYTSGASITGILTLDAAGNSAATWVFQIASTLIADSASSVVLINGASECNVYWAVGSSATLGSTSAFSGNILASASITLKTGAKVQGGLYAGAAITLDTNSITVDGTGCSPHVSISSTSLSPTTFTSSTSSGSKDIPITPPSTLSTLTSSSSISVPSISVISTDTCTDTYSIPSTSTTTPPKTTLTTAASITTTNPGSSYTTSTTTRECEELVPIYGYWHWHGKHIVT